VVDPGQLYIAAKLALCYVYPVILTPETRGSLSKYFFLKIKNPFITEREFLKRCRGRESAAADS
jgi:hypothetical protein